MERRHRLHLTLVILTGLGFLTLPAQPGFAQDEPDPVEAPAPPELPDPAVITDRWIADLEAQLADLLRAARSTPAQQRPLHDLRTDLRIIQRHLLQGTQGSSLDEPATRVALLRARDLQALISAADAATPDQVTGSVEAMRRIHQRTFSLPEGHPDALLAGLGRLTLQALGHPTPASLPGMRPAPAQVREPDLPGGTESPSATPAELAAAVRSMPLAPDLRGELLALARQVEQATGDRSRQESLEVLARAVALADAIARGTGVSPEDRRQVQAQLLTALALFGDERLRDLGRQRMADLEAFTRVVAGTRDLPGGGASDDFARLLVWARSDPQRAARTVQLVRNYFQEVERFGTAPDPDRVRVSAGSKWARAVERLRGGFERRQGQILTAARQWDQPGALLAISFDELRAWVDDLRRINRLLPVLATASTTTAELEAALRITPTGGLERSATQASIVVDDPMPTPQRNAGDDTLLGIAMIAAELERASDLRDRLSRIPAEVDRDYAGGAAVTLPQRHLEVVRTIGLELASQEERPEAWFERRRDQLRANARIANELLDAARLDAAIATAGTVTGWADWSVDDAQLRAMYEPYRQALTRAAQAVGTPRVISAWQAVVDERERMAPMTALIARVAVAADAIAELAPDDQILVTAARLETPSNGRPFAEQRLVSAATDAWVAVRNDPAADREAMDALLSELREGND
jgi:hypothetical protein